MSVELRPTSLGDPLVRFGDRDGDWLCPCKATGVQASERGFMGSSIDVLGKGWIRESQYVVCSECGAQIRYAPLINFNADTPKAGTASGGPVDEDEATWEDDDDLLEWDDVTWD